MRIFFNSRFETNFKICITILPLVISGITKAQKIEVVVPVGHQKPICDKLLTHDGKTLITASSDKICVWNVNTGKLLRTLSQTSSFEWGVRLLLIDSEKLLVSYNREGVLKYFDLKSGRLQKTIETGFSYIDDAAFSETARTIVVSGRDSHATLLTIRLPNYDTALLRTSAREPLKHLFFDVQGKQLTAANDHELCRIDLLSHMECYYLDIRNAKLLKEGVNGVFTQHTVSLQRWADSLKATIKDIHFSLEGQRIAIVGTYREFSDEHFFVSVFDGITGLFLSQTMDTGFYFEDAFLFSADLSLLRIVTSKHTRFWNYLIKKDEYVVENTSNSSKQKKILIETGFSHSSGYISLGYAPNSMKIYDRKKRTTRDLITPPNPSDSLVSGPRSDGLFSQDDALFIQQGTDNSLTSWDTNGWTVFQDYKQFKEFQNKISPDRQYLASSDYKSVRLFDLRNGQWLTTVKIDGSIGGKKFDGDEVIQITGVEFSPDSKLMAVQNFTTGEITLWDIQGDSVRKKLPAPAFGGATTRLRFSNDGTYLAATGWNDGSLYIWENATGRLSNHFLPAAGVKILDFGFSDNQFVAFATNKSWISIFDLRNQLFIDSFPVPVNFHIQFHEERSWLQFASHSTQLVLGSIEGLYVRNYTLQTTIRLKGYPVETYLLSEDGRKIYVSTQDSCIIIALKDGQRIQGCNGRLITAISPPGTTLPVIADKREYLLIANSRTLSVYQPDRDTVSNSILFDKEIATERLLVDNQHDQLLFFSGGDIESYQLFSGKLLFSFIPYDYNDYAFVLPSGYYMSTPKASQQLSFSRENQIFDFDQFDVQNNRPDKVLPVLGIKDEAILLAYQKAFIKRLHYSKFDTATLSKTLALPVTEISANSKVSQVISKEHQSILVHVFAVDKSSLVKTIYVLVNGVIDRTIMFKHGSTDTAVYLTVRLSYGRNLVRAFCEDEKGYTSLKTDLFFRFKPRANVVPPQFWFVGVGVTRYANASYNLQYAAKDIRNIDSMFRKKYGRNYHHVLLLNNRASAVNFMALKRKLASRVSRNDKVVFAFSGHGLNKDTTFYFGTYSISAADPSKAGLSYEMILSVMNALPSRNKLLCLDACYSGDADTDPKDTIVYKVLGAKKGQEGIIKEIRPDNQTGQRVDDAFALMLDLFSAVRTGNGITAICATSGFEVAYEDPNRKNGIFTYALIKGLQAETADRNGDKTITIGELKDYIEIEVSNLTKGAQRSRARLQNFDNDWAIW